MKAGQIQMMPPANDNNRRGGRENDLCYDDNDLCDMEDGPGSEEAEFGVDFREIGLYRPPPADPAGLNDNDGDGRGASGLALWEERFEELDFSGDRRPAARGFLSEGEEACPSDPDRILRLRG